MLVLGVAENLLNKWIYSCNRITFAATDEALSDRYVRRQCSFGMTRFHFQPLVTSPFEYPLDKNRFRHAYCFFEIAIDAYLTDIYYFGMIVAVYISLLDFYL